MVHSLSGNSEAQTFEQEYSTRELRAKIQEDEHFAFEKEKELIRISIGMSARLSAAKMGLSIEKFVENYDSWAQKQSNYEELKSNISLGKDYFFTSNENTEKLAVESISSVDEKAFFYQIGRCQHSSCTEDVGDAYMTLNRVGADMKLSLGEMYTEMGQKEKAKQVYRSIITDYTGSAYASSVKKAEFALDDLKESMEEDMRQQKATNKKKPTKKTSTNTQTTE
jgi:hypothetical protein